MRRSPLRKKRKNKSERQKLHEKAWELQSLSIRWKDAKNGFNKCYTCKKWYPIQQLAAGHWKHGKCDFEEWNIRRQCIFCNNFQSGQRDIFMRNLQREYGVEKVDQFEALAEIKGNYYTEEELKKIIKKYE